MNDYANIPWKYGGDTRDGADCLGLVKLYLREQCGFTAPIPASTEEFDGAAKDVVAWRMSTGVISVRPWGVGDVLFFESSKDGGIVHVAVVTPDGVLNSTKQAGSHYLNDIRLLTRCGLKLCAVISSSEADDLARALADRQLQGLDPGSIIAIVSTIIAIGSSIASMFLMPKPKLGKLRNQDGRYGFDALVTQTNPQIPLPDLMGAVSVAGNSPYQSLLDKKFSAENLPDAENQRTNKVVVVASGPVESGEYNSSLEKINGIPYNDGIWHEGGMYLNPSQTKDAAVTGIIGSYGAQPSLTFYPGTWDITVPVDIRASYDRNFPLYGFNGCAYYVFRLINSLKFSSFNFTASIKGRKYRTFTAAGFDVTTVTSEAVGTGDGTTVRFKLDFDDIKSVTTVTVDGNTYTEMTADSNTGNVYVINKLKGYLEFGTAPAAGNAVVCTYKYYPRAWSQNPAVILVYLLTENIRGKGLPEDSIDWDRANDLQDYCNELVTWTNASGTFTEARYTCNYAIDSRKPIQDHIRPVLDSCYACLFQSNGKFVMKARAADTAIENFNTTNILTENGRSSFSSQMIDRTQRSNRVVVYYHAKETYNAETSVVVDDQYDQDSRVDTAGNRGVIEETLHMLAVDSETQSERLAYQILQENVKTRWVCEFKTNVKGLALEPMDLITVTHPSQPSWSSKVFRIEDLTMDDKDILTIRASEYVDGCYV